MRRIHPTPLGRYTAALATLVAVCGNGRAGKEQVARMVKTLLGLAQEPRPDHAADALAVAICHANCAPLSSALARAGA